MYNTNKTDCLDLVALMKKKWKEAGMTKNLWYRDIQQVPNCEDNLHVNLTFLFFL